MSITPVRDAKSPDITVRVDQENITESIRADSGHCMAAEAVKAAIPNAKRVSVDLQTVRFTDPKKGLRYTYLTPRSVQEALIDFDQGREIHPFAFRLRNAQVTKAGITENERMRKRRMEKPIGGREQSVPVVVGGGTPPIGSLAGGDVPNRVSKARRRAYGLRALER